MENTPFKMIPDKTYIPGMQHVMADHTNSTSVSYLNDVVYADRAGQQLKLQILLPHGVRPPMPGAPAEKPVKRYPLIMYVQGSAWMKQMVYVSLPSLTGLAKAGFIVASVEYRASTEAKWPAFLQDVKSAIRYMRAHADDYSVDPDHVAIYGNSSGGHASLMTGFTGDMEEFKTEDNHEYSDAVQAVVDFYGPTDVTKINDAPRNPIFTADKDHIPEDILYGGCVIDHPEISQPGNPLNYVSADRDLPPVMIAHGDADEMVPFNQSVLIAEKLKECGKFFEFYKVVGAGHGIGFPTDEMNELIVKFLHAMFR